MKAAGILKNLAVGNPAQSATMSSGNNGVVAETGFAQKQLQNEELSIINGYSQYRMNEAQTTLLNQQAITEGKRVGLIDEETATEKTLQNLNRITAGKVSAEKDYINTQNSQAKLDLYINTYSQLISNDSTMPLYNTIKDMAGTVLRGVKSIKEVANELWKQHVSLVALKFKMFYNG